MARRLPSLIGILHAVGGDWALLLTLWRQRSGAGPCLRQRGRVRFQHIALSKTIGEHTALPAASPGSAGSGVPLSPARNPIVNLLKSQMGMASLFGIAPACHTY
jgi:hypothetical protein